MNRETIRQAVSQLDVLKKAADDEALSAAAENLAIQLFWVGRGGPMNSLQRKSFPPPVPEDYEPPELEDAFDKFKKAATSKKGAVYESDIFKCLGDYATCCKEHRRAICIAVATICIASHLIPFVKGT